MKKYYLIFSFKKDKNRYYLILDSKKYSHQLATCLMYCNHLYKVNIFNNIRVKTEVQNSYFNAGESYKESIIQCIKRGYI